MANFQSFKTTIRNMHGNVWSCGILIPNQVASIYIKSGNKRVICTINKEVSYPCAILSAGDQGYFINLNKEHRKKLRVDVNDEVHVNLEPDNSEYGMPLPEEMEAAFEIEMEGKVFFDQLTPGKQRSLLYIVGQPKSTEIRIKKALVILQYLAQVQGKLDFKELNLAFKQANNSSL